MTVKSSTSSPSDGHSGRLSAQSGASGHSKLARRAGWALTAFVGLFMVFDGVIKLAPITAVAQTLGPLGFRTDVGFERGLGVLGLTCTILYLVPQTALLGAILLTGYLGGAMAAQLRVGNPLFSHLFFGAYLGIMAWGGLWLRLSRLRRALPIIRAGFDADAASPPAIRT